MINDESLKTIIEEVIGNNDPYWNTQVYDIVKKIIDLPNETTTTIADLINYNPKEAFVEPLTQGQIIRLVKETCKKLNIELEENRDSFSGLAYYYQFKKINNDKVKSYMEEFINKPVPELSDEEKEYEKYCKLYEEKFGKRVYIAEPSGTREQTINAIKICLEKNEDLLDKLLYPNLENDMNNEVLYSELKQEEINDKQTLNAFDDDRKTINFLCNNCGTSTSMSFRKKFTTGNKVYARCTNCGNEISADNPFN